VVLRLSNLLVLWSLLVCRPFDGLLPCCVILLVSRLACARSFLRRLQQICDGLRVLKAARIVHSDLFLRNVFLNWDPVMRKYCVRIGDFGLCQDLGDKKTATERLWLKYSAHVAPEVDGKSPFNEQVCFDQLICPVFTNPLAGRRLFMRRDAL
jgi:serine/threonine protein kinase